MDALTLVAELDRALPGFAEYFGSKLDVFEGDTPCAAFASCSHFVRERVVALESWRLLAILLNELTSGSDEVAADAACTCFLENLADPDHPLKPFLEGEALRYWTEWEKETRSGACPKKISWWIDESSLPNVVWARECLLPDGSVEVLEADGRETRFRSHVDAANALSEEGYVRPESIESESLARLGLLEREVRPLLGQGDVGAGVPMRTDLECADAIRDLAAVDWREPWSLLSPIERESFESELDRELAAGHPLHGRPARAYLRRTDCDDVLFVMSRPVEVAVVHLTYTGQPPEQPPWPSTEVYWPIWRFVDRTLRDAADYEAD